MLAGSAVTHTAAFRRGTHQCWHSSTAQRCRRPVAAAADSSSNSNVQIGKELLAGRADAEAAMQWREATVLENRCSGQLKPTTPSPAC